VNTEVVRVDSSEMKQADDRVFCVQRIDQARVFLYHANYQGILLISYSLRFVCFNLKSGKSCGFVSFLHGQKLPQSYPHQRAVRKPTCS